jgi:pilus assembly protein CpaF
LQHDGRINAKTEVTEERMTKWRSLIRERVDADAAPLTTAEKGELLQAVLDEVFGFGPLGPLLRDPTLGDIFVNGCYAVYAERNDRLEKTSVRFDSERHLLQTIDKILQPLGYHLDKDNPVVHATLPNGSWVVATIPPVSCDGPTLTIRCFGASLISLGELVSKKVLTTTMAEVLKACIKGRISIAIAGSNGYERTALLNALSAHIAPAERIITVEQPAEMRLQHDHWIRLTTPLPGRHEKGEQTGGVLINTALHMRPDRIILGDCSQNDAFEFMNAIKSGVKGCICTISATSPRDCLQRLQSMIRIKCGQISHEEARELIASALQLIVHIEKMEDGARRITEIAEITEVEDGIIELNSLFKIQRKGRRTDGYLICDYVSSGKQPKFVPQLERERVVFKPEWLEQKA